MALLPCDTRTTSTFIKVMRRWVHRPKILPSQSSLLRIRLSHCEGSVARSYMPWGLLKKACFVVAELDGFQHCSILGLLKEGGDYLVKHQLVLPWITKANDPRSLICDSSLLMDQSIILSKPSRSNIFTSTTYRPRCLKHNALTQTSQDPSI